MEFHPNSVFHSLIVSFCFGHVISLVCAVHFCIHLILHLVHCKFKFSVHVDHFDVVTCLVAETSVLVDGLVEFLCFPVQNLDC